MEFIQNLKLARYGTNTLSFNRRRRRRLEEDEENPSIILHSASQ